MKAMILVLGALLTNAAFAGGGEDFTPCTHKGHAIQCAVGDTADISREGLSKKERVLVESHKFTGFCSWNGKSQNVYFNTVARFSFGGKSVILTPSSATCR